MGRGVTHLHVLTAPDLRQGDGTQLQVEKKKKKKNDLILSIIQVCECLDKTAVLALPLVIKITCCSSINKQKALINVISTFGPYFLIQ